MAAPQDQLCVVLVAPRNPLNIGAAARAMSNFGFLRLRVVNPYDVAFREARSAVGASELLANAEEYKSLADAIADCTLVVGTTAVRHRELQHPLKRLEQGARAIRKHLASGRVALLFGTEKFGLATKDLSHCHWLMRIPTREEHISMNLGQAVAVCLYELIRDSKAAPGKEKLQRSKRSRNRAHHRVLLDSLRGSGYVKTRTEASTEDKVRRWYAVSTCRSADAELWLGMLRQMLWKIRASGK